MIVGERRESKRKGWLLLLLLLLKVKTNCKMSQQKEFSYTQFNTRIDLWEHADFRGYYMIVFLLNSVVGI